MTPKARLFIDSSVWLTGLGSPLGAAGWIFFLAESGEIAIVTSEQILEEVRRNLEVKKIRHGTRLDTFLTNRKPLVLSRFREPELLRWVFLVPPKDCHVLAGAFKAKADALLTLDKDRILVPKVRSSFQVPIMSPGEFLVAFHEEEKR